MIVDEVMVENNEIEASDIAANASTSQANLNTAELFENTAKSYNSEVIYAYDDDGKQLAIGLVLDGPLDKEKIVETDENGDVQYPTENSDVMHPKMDWVAAEEVCTSTQVENTATNIGLKEEADVKVGKVKRSEMVKVYKRKQGNKKTVKTLKMQLEAVRRKLQKAESSKKKKVFRSKRNKDDGVTQRKHTTTGPGQDKAYRCSVPFKDLRIKSTYFWVI